MFCWARPLRCTLVWLAATALAAATVGIVGADAAALGAGLGADLEQALVRSGSAVLVGCAAWGWLATTAVVLQAARGRAAHGVRGVPQAWRRLVLLACGTTLAAAGLGGTASADNGLDGLPLPDRATDGAPAVAPPLAPARPAALDHLVVRPGDSLWTLAATRLGPHASADEIDRLWRRLYRLNRSALGPDPDLIRPGQQLRLPPPPQERP
jgi:hypothetical protein